MWWLIDEVPECIRGDWEVVRGIWYQVKTGLCRWVEIRVPGWSDEWPIHITLYTLCWLWVSLNFIYFKMITKQAISLILIMLVGTDVCVRLSSCGRNPEYPEETHLSDLMTTWSSHVPRLCCVVFRKGVVSYASTQWLRELKYCVIAY